MGACGDYAYVDCLCGPSRVTSEAHLMTGMLRGAGDPLPCPLVVLASCQLIRQREGIWLTIGWIGRQGPFDDTAKAK